jgi:hypothetical protein
VPVSLLGDAEDAPDGLQLVALTAWKVLAERAQLKQGPAEGEEVG